VQIRRITMEDQKYVQSQLRKRSIRLGIVVTVTLTLGLLVGQAAWANQKGGLPDLEERVFDLEDRVVDLEESSGNGGISGWQYYEEIVEDSLGNADVVNCPSGKVILGGGIGVYGDNFNAGGAPNTATSWAVTQSMPKAPIPDDPGYGWTYSAATDGTVDIFVRIICADP
jgi:hypothetical protein